MSNQRRKIGEKAKPNGRNPFSASAERGEAEIHALAHRAAALAVQASLDGLDAATAVMAAAIHVAFPEDMSRRDIADWMRRFAAEMEADPPTQDH